MERRCNTCEFFKPYVQSPHGSISDGTCRKLPPTASRWPEVLGGDWCGSYRTSVAEKLRRREELRASGAEPF